MKNITVYERKLIAMLLEMAGHRFSNDSCNDLSKEAIDLLTDREWVYLTKKFHDWNGDPEEFDHSWPVQNYSMLMYYFSALILEDVKS